MMKEKKDILYSLLGQHIKDKRNSKNISQSKLASLLKMSRPSIVNIEKGRQHLSIHLLIEICSILDLSVSEFFTEFIPLSLNKKEGLADYKTTIGGRMTKSSQSKVEEFISIVSQKHQS